MVENDLDVRLNVLFEPGFFFFFNYLLCEKNTSLFCFMHIFVVLNVFHSVDYKTSQPKLTLS